MSYYCFNIKKGKFELALISMDKKFVARQFDKIYSDLAGKSKTEKPEIQKQPEKIEQINVQKQEKSFDISKNQTELPKIPQANEILEKSKPEIQETPETSLPESSSRKQFIKPQITHIPIQEKIIISQDKPETEEDSMIDEVEKASISLIEEDYLTENTAEVETEEHNFEDDEVIPMQGGYDFKDIIEQKLKEQGEDTDFEDGIDKETPVRETITYYEEKESQEKEPESVPVKDSKNLSEILDQKLEIRSRKEMEERDLIPTNSLEDTISEEIELLYTEKKVEEPASSSKKNKVYDILNEKLSGIPAEVKNRLKLNRQEEKPQKEDKNSYNLKFKNLDDLIYLKKPQTRLDNLLVVAYYFQEREACEKFSLKQINSRILRYLEEPIDHSIIHEAVAHSYIEVVPDMTGISNVTEYKITNEGIDYLLNEL